MEKLPDTLQEAIVYFSDADHCQNFMIDIRWPDGKVKCPHCDSKNVGYLVNARVWKCYNKHDDKKSQKFSLKVGTIFEDSPLGLDKWFPAAWLIINCKNGVSSYEIARDLGVTQKSAWFMLHRIRLAMQTGTFEKMKGIVEADETFIGGLAKNMHSRKRNRIFREGPGATGKTIVMGILERGDNKERASRVKLKMLPTVSKSTLGTAVTESVNAGSTLYTDEHRGYQALAQAYAHEFVNHTEKYVRGAVHTNGIENFWSLLKRTIKGTYISVEPFHLTRYLDEQSFRFNNRKLTDGERFAMALVGIVGRRLTYESLTGKDQTVQP